MGAAGPLTCSVARELPVPAHAGGELPVPAHAGGGWPVPAHAGGGWLVPAHAGGGLARAGPLPVRGWPVQARCRWGRPQVRLDGALNPIRRELCSPVAFRVQAADDDSDGVRLPGHPARLERCELASKWSELGVNGTRRLTTGTQPS